MSKKILSVFIDESGDFGPFKSYSPYYIVAMVFHDQNIDISADIAGFESRLDNSNHGRHAVHTGPLIRRESIYKNDTLKERKALFNSLFHFSRRLDVKYICVKVKKREYPDVLTMAGKLSKSISEVLNSNEAFWSSFDHIIIYYDNGQIELTKILISIFYSLYTNVEFRKVKAVDYRLFQVADLICTMELLSEKADSGNFSGSEVEFFGSIRSFKKSYLRYLRKKQL